jgi:hypothetical protein
MEADLSSKMTEFMTVIDQVKKYRALLASLPNFIIILALTIIGFLAVSVSSKLGLVFITYNHPFWIPLDNSIQIILVVIGIIAAVFYVNRRLHLVKVGQWQMTLQEGAPGAIKLLQQLDWDNIYRDIRYAKLGFGLYGVLKTSAYWLLTFVISYFAASYVSNIIHWNVDSIVIALFSLALIIALTKKDIQKRFDQIGRLDALLWELRWFDNDFRRKDFEA